MWSMGTAGILVLILKIRSRTGCNSRIDVGSQFVVEMCHDYSFWNASMRFLRFGFHFDFTNDSNGSRKPKEWRNSFLRESWQLPNRALYELKFISSPSGILLSRHKSAWFR